MPLAPNYLNKFNKVLLFLIYPIPKYMYMLFLLNDFLFIQEFIVYLVGQRGGWNVEHCDKCYFIIYLYV